MVYQENKRFPIVRRRSGCYNCGDVRHYINECPDIQCHNCKQFGHVAFKCPNKWCYKCRERGHVVAECPNDMTINCWTCKRRRSEAYIVVKEKTIYYCTYCREEDSSIK